MGRVSATTTVRDVARPAGKVEAALAALESFGRGGGGGGGAGGAGGGANEKSISLEQYGKLWAAGREGFLSLGLNEPLKPYQTVLWYHLCVRRIAETAKGIPVRLLREGPDARTRAKSFRADIRRSKRRTLRPVRGAKAVCVGRAAEGETIESGPALDLLERPNNYQDWPTLFFSTVGYLLCRGRVAWVLTGLVGRRPEEIHVVDGAYIKPVWLHDERRIPTLIGYEYRPPKTGRPIALAIDEAKYFSLWDDGEDPLGALSPATPGRLALATEYNASLFNASLLVNGAEPGIKIKFPQTLTEEQRDEYRAAFAQRHQGPAKAKRALILEGGADADTMGLTMADLQFIEGKRVTRQEICSLLGVHPAVVGLIEATGDSSAYFDDALRQFFELTIMPLLDGFAPAVQELVSRFDAGAVAWFDVEDAPVVQKMRLARLDSAQKLFAIGYPPNRINDLLDLGMPDVPWGEMGYLPAGLLPASEVAEATAVSPDGEPPLEPGAGPVGEPAPRGAAPEAAEAKAGQSRRRETLARIWRAWAQSYEGLAREGRGLLRARFVGQERKILAALRKAVGTDVIGSSSSVNPQSAIRNPQSKADPEPVIARIVLEVFQDPKDRHAFQARIRRFQASAQRLGLAQALAEAGLTGDPLKEAMRRILADPRVEAALNHESVIVSTKIDANVREAIKRDLAEGLAAGEDIRHLATRVQVRMRNLRGSAMRIARNTIGQTLSRARHEGHLSSGMTHKTWVHARGPGVRRPLHVAAEAHYEAHPAPIAEPFVVNGARLMYPRDFSSGRPDETMNCQCLSIAKRFAAGTAPTRDAILADYAAGHFVTWERLGAVAGPANDAPPPGGPEHGERDESD